MPGHLTNCDCDLCRMCVYSVTLPTEMIPIRGLIIPAMPQQPVDTSLPKQAQWVLAVWAIDTPVRRM